MVWERSIRSTCPVFGQRASSVGGLQSFGERLLLPYCTVPWRSSLCGSFAPERGLLQARCKQARVHPASERHTHIPSYQNQVACTKPRCQTAYSVLLSLVSTSRDKHRTLFLLHNVGMFKSTKTRMTGLLQRAFPCFKQTTVLEVR